MKLFSNDRRRSVILAGTAILVALTPLGAYPPAPHHTIFGMVRNEWGDPLNISASDVLLEPLSGTPSKTAMFVGLEPGVNYRMQVPMDSGTAADFYKPTALRPLLPFKLKVRIGQVTYLPIEMAGDYARIGQPGQQTRIDLTLGEDSDGDGLPDAWERALIAALGGNLTLADIRPGNDSDGDGISNLNEYLAGTYPFDPADGFSLSIVGFQAGAPALEFLAIRGRTYSIQASSDLRQWTPVQFQIATEGSQAPLLNTYRATDVRLLRVSVPFQSGASTNRYFKAVLQ